MAHTNTEAPATSIPAAPLTTIATLGKHEGESVTLHAWLYNLRASGKLLFPIFRDGSGTIQGIVPKAAVSGEVFESIKKLTQESSVIVTGKVRADARAPGGFELDVENVEVVQRVSEDTPFPISLKEHGTDFLMEHRHLWIRTPRQSAILRIRAEIIKAARDYFDDNGFTLTDPPIPYPRCLRRHQHALSRRILRRRSVPDTERPVVYREHSHGAGQGVQLRSDLPRGEVEDAPASDRILDGRAGRWPLPILTT